jgi:hypothetical protein
VIIFYSLAGIFMNKSNGRTNGYKYLSDAYRPGRNFVENGLVMQGHKLRERVDGDLKSIREAMKATGEEIRGAMENEKRLSPEQIRLLFETLKARFEDKKNRKNRHHNGLEWKKIQEKLEASPEKLWSLNEMERTGGEPDVVKFDKDTDEYIFYDCSPESPKGRRNCAYDEDAEKDLKKNGSGGCNGNAVSMAASMGIKILTADEYLYLQELEKCDFFSWNRLLTLPKERGTGVALIGYRELNDVFINSCAAEYSNDSEGFRGLVRV